MSTIEIKQELHDIINKSDQKFLKLFYKLAKSSIYQLKEEEMILDGEKDIAAGRIHSQDEVQKIIESWKKQLSRLLDNQVSKRFRKNIFVQYKTL